MENFKVSLYLIEKKSKCQPYLYLVLGFLYLTFGIFKLGSEKSEIFDWLWIFSGIGFFIGGFYQNNYQSKYYLEVNDEFLSFRQSIGKPTLIKITSIERIHIKPIAIEIIKFDSQKSELSLANVGYKKVLDIKEKLRNFSSENNIRID